MCVVTLAIFSAFLVNISPLGGEETVRESFTIGMAGTFTVMPELKTKHRADFKKEWETKKDEVVRKYLKK